MDPTDFFQNTMTEDFNGSNDFFGPNYNTCDSVLNSEKPVEHTEDTAGTLNVQNTQNAQKDESQPELVEQETPLSESGYVAPRSMYTVCCVLVVLDPRLFLPTENMPCSSQLPASCLELYACSCVCSVSSWLVSLRDQGTRNYPLLSMFR